MLMISRGLYLLFLILMLPGINCVAQNQTPNYQLDSVKLKEFYNYIKWTYNYGTQKEFDSTNRYSKRALILAKKLKNDDIIAFAKICAARIQYWQLKIEEARILLNENTTSKTLNDSILFESYLLHGEIDVYDRQYKQGASHLIEGERLIEKRGITTKKDSSDYVVLNLNFAELYKSLKDYDKAHLYYDKAFKFYGDISASSYILYYKSELFQEANNIKKAISALKHALNLIGNKPEGKLFLPTYCERLSKLYHHLKKTDSALFYAKKGLYNNEDCKLDVLNMAVGDAYSLNKDYAHAFNYYEEALKVSKSKDFEMKIHEKLRDVNTKLKDFEKALTHNTLFLNLKDSIIDLKIQQEVTEIAEKYESNKKQLEIETLKVSDYENQVLINKQKDSIKFTTIGLLSSIFILSLIFYGYFKQKKQKHLLFTKNLRLAKELKLKDSLKNKSSNSKIEITDSKRTNIQLKIETLISNEFYLDQHVTLVKMAKLVETNTSYLSKIINSTYHVPFSSFINDLRISYTLKNLESKPEFRKLTIEHIADKSGFSSNSAFYNAFKKHTGLTPSYYIKKRLAQ